MFKTVKLKNKKTSILIFLVCALVYFLISGSCDLSHTGKAGAANTTGSFDGSRSLVAPAGFTTVLYAPDNLGYLQTNPAGKKFMHLEGSGYVLGYQHGYLLAASVERMTSADFVIAVLSNYLGISVQEFKTSVGASVTAQVISALQSAARSFESDVPAEYIEELHGIVNGAAARGYTVSYDNLLVNNLAFDILLGIAYPIVAPYLGISSVYTAHMCDGFIVYGSGTTDGRTLMGRNFMFTDAFIHEEMLMVEYVPASGYKFVTPTLPGWAGLVSGMNEQGVGIGIDMAPALASYVGSVGMGAVLASRRALQYSSSLSQGIGSIRSAGLGISWIIAIGSGINEIGGAVIETAATLNKTRSANYTYPWLYSLISALPKQIESKSNLVVFANHFIVPEMVLLAGNPTIADSAWRYQTLTNLILSNFGTINTAKGRQLVDYLHPPAYNYYGTDTTAAVKGSRSLYDLKNRELWSLYGHYNDQWMDYKF